uniref:3,4-dihydroxy-2-butanone 4-phosphate synthase n=1 Tax=Candidatus Kentrum eta TaxID=2126337 RepID=A0A450VID9_9GAMM|nr:MAG: GTP cyclohydrolase II /3,4-dihydroxy-2-butanone 4-phosphate synthase [Candidatus Kentron sp. H]VFJ99947.1 MAG: GTP cyclohydrolase II /3,4-dihydroxy-2-butanone 4-phosphate synthase [Candidatus Kentron sp. H]VFK04525.1 MAG: GTP cyclohydrolase II /3,4-dihydroxy-2-butanone 4-phosphate synthase [Candidatus Kentron sp. H]
MALNTIEELIADFRKGKIVIFMDDEDRENEGDLIMAGALVRPEDINFMATFGRGLICQTMTRERCQQLNLPLMVNESGALHGTKFTVSIDAADGVTTGISAKDRAVTIRTAAKSDASPTEIVQPGHIFPLMAEAGGVLTRAGHTEAGCDLARLAGLEPTAVIVEILNEDGTMARRPDLEQFAARHGLKMGTIADLIQYRMTNEKTVERVGECAVTNEYGRFRLYAYQDTIDGDMHLAMVMGDMDPDAPTLVRVHVADFLCDMTGCQRPDCGWPLTNVLRRVAQEGAGVVLILRREERGKDLIERVQRYQKQDEGVKVPQRETSPNLRTHGLGAQILVDLGVRRMRVLSAPKKMAGISGFGLEVVEYVT